MLWRRKVQLTPHFHTCVPFLLHKIVELSRVVSEFDSWVFIILLSFWTMYLHTTVLNILLLWLIEEKKWHNMKTNSFDPKDFLLCDMKELQD